MPEDEQSNQNGEPKDSSDSSQQEIPDAGESDVPVQPSGAEIGRPWVNVINAALLIVLVVSGGILLVRLSGENAEEVLALIAIMTPVIGGILAALIGRERRETLGNFIKKQFDELRTTALLAILSVIVLALLALNLTGRFPIPPDQPLAQPRQTTAVRAGPSRQYAVLESVTPDQMVGIIGISDDGGWYQVSLPGGGSGWLEAGSVAVQGSVNVKIVIAPTITPTPSITPTASDTPSPAPSATSTDTPSPTLTPTDTPTDTPTPSPTPRPPSPTPRPSDTPTVVVSPSNTDIAIFADATSFTIYIVSPTSLKGVGIVAAWLERTYLLEDAFDILQTNDGLVYPGDCYIYYRTGVDPTLPMICTNIQRIFKRPVQFGDVFWYGGGSFRNVALRWPGSSSYDTCSNTSLEQVGCWLVVPPTPTPSPTDTPTSTPTPTFTPSPTDTPTPTPTFTPSPTDTPTFTPTLNPFLGWVEKSDGAGTYLVQERPVSNREFAAFVRSYNYSDFPVEIEKPGEGGKSPVTENDEPYNRAAWYEADAYCKWLWENGDEYKRLVPGGFSLATASILQTLPIPGTPDNVEWTGDPRHQDKYPLFDFADRQLSFKGYELAFEAPIFRCMGKTS